MLGYPRNTTTEILQRSIPSCEHISFKNSVYLWFFNPYIHTYIHTYIHAYIHIYACGPKTVPVKRTFLNIAIVGWGGGGMLTFLVLRTWNIATLLTSLGSFTTLYVAMLLMGWGGVGWGGMLTFLVLRTWNIATLLRSLGSFTTLHVATLLMGWGGVGGHVNVPCTSYMIYCHAAEISGIVYYVTCCYAAAGVGWGGGGMLTFLVLRTWNIATLLRSPGSFTTLHVATLLKVESDERVNSQQLECQKWPLDGVC